MFLAASALAFDFSSLKPEGYLSDFARVVGGAEKQEIERFCREIEDRTGAQIALVTLPSLEGEPVSDVANLLYRKWGIGQKKTNEGVLLLLAVRDRKSRLEVGYGLEPILPDGSAGTILRAMRPALRENHYGDAMLAAAKSIGERILEAKGQTGQVQPPRAVRRRPVESMIPWETVVFVLFLVFLFSMMSRRGVYRGGRGAFPVILPVMGGGYGYNFPRRGGGGFGGMSDSGGGFGGFGGGDSGGGGASSDW